MYLFFDTNGTLKEQITTSPVRVGDENVNNIYVYWENHTPNDGYCIYRKPDGNNTQIIYKTKFTTGLQNDPQSIIPYDQNRDLKYFKYNTPYRFCVFEIPSEVFVSSDDDINSVLFSCWLVYNTDSIKTMSLVAFAVEPSTLRVSADQNINVAQWNALLNMLTGTADLTNIDVLSITFKESENPSENGLSMKDNVIYWRGVRLVTSSDLNAYVNTSETQNISGYKTFLGGIGLENAPLEIENGSEIPLGVFTVHDDDNTTDYNIKADGGEDNATYDIKLPNKNGTLAIDGDVVHKTGDETIDGKKTFRDDLQLSNDAKIISYGTQANTILEFQDDVDGNEYVVKFPNESGTLVTKNDMNTAIHSALTPIILAPVVCGPFDTIDGGETNVLMTGGVGSHTVNVIANYEIVAEVDSGTITNIDQTTGVISIISSEESVELSWHYESTRIGFRFNIGSDYNGIYVFTHSYLTMLVPIYALTDGQTYKFTGVGLQDGVTGSVINMVHNMQRNGQYLDIWSGNSDYPMITGRVGTLAKVKLY